jgi:hypothetical protein
MNSLISILFQAPESQLDSSIKQEIRSWSSPPKAIEVLKALDDCVYGSLASGFVIHVLNILYNDACKNENTSHEEVVKNASWRLDR